MAAIYIKVLKGIFGTIMARPGIIQAYRGAVRGA